MDDPMFETGWLRTQNYDVLEPILNEALKGRTTREWMEEFEQARIPCGPVNSIDRVANDPQIAARDMIIDVAHPEAGSFKVVNTPFKFSRTSCEVELASPDLGQHTEEVLTRLLGMTHEEVSMLRSKGLI
jgi:crotonobetainyl-CoA:carnitine CoA-transferase CaiB-like acyl-CoA transferase